MRRASTEQQINSSRADRLVSAIKHFECQDCGFDLHSRLTPDDLPDRQCPKCRGTRWDFVPKPPPASAGIYPTHAASEKRKVRVPDPLPIRPPRRLDRLEMAAAARK
jgi:hypothetical protein